MARTFTFYLVLMVGSSSSMVCEYEVSNAYPDATDLGWEDADVDATAPEEILGVDENGSDWEIIENADSLAEINHGETPSPDGSEQPIPQGVAMILTIPQDPQKIAVMTFTPDGSIVDHNIRLDVGIGPRRVAFRKDAREAMVIYAGAGPDSKKGAAVISLEPDGSQAQVVQEIELEADKVEKLSPVDLFYASDDEVVIGLRGPGDDKLQNLVRNQGQWEIGIFKICPNSPLQFQPLPQSGHALMLQVGFLDNQSFVVPIGRDGEGGWQIEGAGVEYGTLFPIEMALHPSGMYAYVPTSDPKSSQELNPDGLIHVLVPSQTPPAWEETINPLAMEQLDGSQIALSWDGTIAVINDAVAARDPITGEITIVYNQFVTLSIAENGQPALAKNPTTRLDVQMINDFAFSPYGQLVAAFILKNETPIDPGQTRYPMIVYELSETGGWTPMGDPIYLPSGPYHISFGPVVP